MRWSGVSKSSTREVGDHAADLVVAPHRTRRARRRGRSRRRDTTSTFSHEHARRVVRDPVARGVVDRVAGRAAEAEQLRLRLAPTSPMHGDVLVAVRGRSGCAPIITWRRPDHTTSNIVRYGFHASTTLSRRSPPTGIVVGDEQRLAVGHHQVGLERWRGPAGRRSSGWCRSGWPGSRRRRGSTRRRATTQTSARASASSSLTARPPSGTRRGRRSRGTSPATPPTRRASCAAPRTRFWNASSRP